MFSTAANVQGKTQNRMKFEQLEMRTLISHNKELIRGKIFEEQEVVGNECGFGCGMWDLLGVFLH